MLRKATMAAVLAGAVGVPYAIWNGGNATESISRWWSSSEEQTDNGATSEHPPTATPASQTFAQNPANTYDPTAYGPTVYNQPSNGAPSDRAIVQPPPAAGAALAQPPAMPQTTRSGPTAVALAEVLNLNVNRQWVTARWSRVTTALADTHYDGLRVALVTGTQPGDLSGSLTYYFDRRDTLQRITFHGVTGDPQPLIALLTGQMEFEKRKSLGGELYTRSWLGRTTSVCRIRPAAVIHAGAANSRYEVLLELNRGQWKSNLSPAARQLLN